MDKPIIDKPTEDFAMKRTKAYMGKPDGLRAVRYVAAPGS